ncbi:metalloregulator ArsR/SmtB family transcription factor [uncultured Cohaesibacter sp.]|uniref:ArsR/SmtB family transcription factor n=1 Tax=uncultured Cohaesibacter sp. TaxID=1002546 RepID=UPI0029C80485|nr:metalloregulator ArsR/SmtB family transcription factor [uncultured Cohaesibacter sp.]
MENITNIFGALSDPIRLRILALIAEETELCVCELVGALELPQPKISRHCKVLNEANLLSSRREAQWVLYSLSEDNPDWARQAVTAAIEGVRKDPHHAVDRARLTSVQRPPVRCDLTEKQAC